MAGNAPNPRSGVGGLTAQRMGQQRPEFVSVNKVAANQKASPIPITLGAISVLVGVILMVRVLTSSSEAVLWLGIAGYLSAGFLPPLFLGWDALSQRRGLKNPNFRARREFGRVLRVIVFVGIAVAIVHLWIVADVLALTVSELLFVWGVLTQ